MEPETSPVMFVKSTKDFVLPVFWVLGPLVLAVLFPNSRGCDGYAFLSGYFLANACSELLEWYRHKVEPPKGKLLLHFVPGDLPCFVVTLILTVTCWHDKTSSPVSVLAFAFVLCFVRRVFTELHPVEIRTLRERWKLAPGYFSAASYYYNYLKLFVPDVFLNRVKEFQKRQGVEVTQKLFVLVPKSCKRKKTIDDNTQIERSRELPTFSLNVAGVVGRVYEITVYRVSEDLDSNDGYRCCVEYAQPLNTLRKMYTLGEITKNEMHQELIMFVQTLYRLLHDENDSYRICQLLCYDDDDTELVEILLQACES